MRHAALVIAHKNLDQLIRLIHSLEDKDIHVYIHLDKKWKITPADIELLTSTSPNVTVLKKRISGFWDAWSLCEITELIKAALMSGFEYSYYMLLSGQDYPIKPISDKVQ